MRKILPSKMKVLAFGKLRFGCLGEGLSKEGEHMLEYKRLKRKKQGKLVVGRIRDSHGAKEEEFFVVKPNMSGWKTSEEKLDKK